MNRRSFGRSSYAPVSFLSDIATELRALDVSTKSLRSFGRVVGGVLLLLGLIALWRRDWQFTATGIPGLLFGLGGALIVLGAVAPALLRPVYRVWMGLALVLGFVMTRVLLTLFFIIAITPIGWLRRTFGTSSILMRPSNDATSYWIEREPEADDPKERLTRLY